MVTKLIWRELKCYSLEPLDQFSTKLETIAFLCKGNLSLLKWRTLTFFQVYNYISYKAKIQLWHLKIFSKPNLAKAFLSLGNSSLFNWRATPFPREENSKIAKIDWRHMHCKTILLRNHWASWHKALLDEGDSSLLE